jgi:stress-induced morphogen
LRQLSAALDLPARRDYLEAKKNRSRAMAITVEDLETLLKEGFPNAKITITDLAGDGNHYAAEVIDESFRGLNRVQQQRAVYAALKGKMDGSHGELHALALTTKAPD